MTYPKALTKRLSGAATSFRLDEGVVFEDRRRHPAGRCGDAHVVHDLDERCAG
jgi:hypothetical protein